MATAFGNWSNDDWNESVKEREIYQATREYEKAYDEEKNAYYSITNSISSKLYNIEDQLDIKDELLKRLKAQQDELNCEERK